MRYQVKIFGDTHGILDNETGRFDPRPQYNVAELLAVVRWLNSREFEYAA